jgi:GDP-L-fucose synthase
MNIDSKIYVAGHNGMVGSALVRRLNQLGYHNIVVANRNQLDLINQYGVYQFIGKERPDYVFLAAAKVGGINDNNTKKADYIYDNMMIQSNIINASHKFAVKKLLFLGSSCIYPKMSPQPIKEEYLLTGSLEPTNDAYAIAKISGIKMCQSFNQQYETNFISVMPTNLFGPNDNYDLKSSHVFTSSYSKISRS